MLNCIQTILISTSQKKEGVSSSTCCYTIKMKPFDFKFPTKIIMGEGRLNELGHLAKEYGDKAFLVYDPFLKGSQTLEDIKHNLAENELDFVEFNDISPNPRNTSIDAGTRLCVDEKCEVVIAIGGGSAIDSAKANALVAANGGNCWEYTERAGEDVTRPTKPSLPMIVVPTTAGTGTEATSFAVINNPSEKRKCTIISPTIFPDIALVDPEIMKTIPPMITALTGLDTFAHALESYISVNATPISEMLSLYSIELFAKSIREAVHNGNNVEARDQMALACGLGGAAIGTAGVTLPHALGQPLGALTDAPHGGTLAACFPQIIEWTLPYAEEKLAKVSELLDSKLNKNLTKSEKAAELPRILHELYTDLGVDVSFGKYGLKEESIEELADLCFVGFLQDLSAHPKPVTREDVIQLIHACM